MPPPLLLPVDWAHARRRPPRSSTGPERGGQSTVPAVCAISPPSWTPPPLQPPRTSTPRGYKWRQQSRVQHNNTLALGVLVLGQRHKGVQRLLRDGQDGGGTFGRGGFRRRSTPGARWRKNSFDHLPVGGFLGAPRPLLDTCACCTVPPPTPLEPSKAQKVGLTSASSPSLRFRSMTIRRRRGTFLMPCTRVMAASRAAVKHLHRCGSSRGGGSVKPRRLVCLPVVWRQA